MSSRYQVVEKSSKQDGQGNLQCELWLRDGTGGYSLLRLERESFEAFRLGDQVELALQVVCSSQSSVMEAEIQRGGDHA